MGAQDISIPALLVGLLAMAVPVWILAYFKTGLVRSTFLSFGRMIAQMALLGVYLKWIFELNSAILNVGWVLVMAAAAGATLQKRTGRKFSAKRLSQLVAAVTISMVANGAVFAFVQIGVEDFFNAWYIIPMLGMMLGNCLGSSVIGLRSYDNRLAKQEMAYKYMLLCGASRREALFPFISGAIRDAMAPSIAQTAAIGLIWLPGMMTGQILGGSDPTTAIKYQILILTTIFSASVITLFLSIIFTVRSDFDEYGLLKK